MKLVQQWQSRLNRPEGVPVDMTTRAFKTLQTASEKTGEPVTKELARNLIETRVLSRTEHCGPKTFEEIKEWAYS